MFDLQFLQDKISGPVQRVNRLHLIIAYGYVEPLSASGGLVRLRRIEPLQNAIACFTLTIWYNCYTNPVCEI